MNRFWIVVQVIGLALGVVWAGVLYTGCGGCNTALDCGGSRVCLEGQCKDKPEGSDPEPGDEPQVTPDDAGTSGNEPVGNEPNKNEPKGEETNTGDQDGGSVETKPELPPGPQAGDLVINEVLFDPPTDQAGDANKDGTRSSSDDEFIEIVNTSTSPINVSGVTLDIDGKTYKVPDGIVLPALTAVVIFGGGMKSDTEVNTGKPHSKFGDALVFTEGDGAGLPSLTNGGATIKLMAADGTELDVFTYGSAECPGGSSVDQSLNRKPDATTGTCGEHKAVSGPAAALFSPGTRADGSKFSDPLPEPPPAEDPGEGSTGEGSVGEGPAETVADGGAEAPTESTPTEQPNVQDQPVVETPPEGGAGQVPTAGDLIVNEVHADPDTTKGDANGDGKTSTSEDEFIEIVNKGNKTLQMQGVEVLFKTTVVFTFPSVTLKSNQAVVIFRGGLANDSLVGSGQAHTKFGGALVYKMSKSTALTNSGGTVEVKLGATSFDIFTYGSGCAGDKNQSVTRSPDLTPNSCKIHTDADPNKSLFSPGKKADGTNF